MFLIYEAKVKNQLNRKIKWLGSNRGGGYKLFDDLCEKQWIIDEITPPYPPESNRVVEKKNRSLKQMINVLLVSSSALDNL